jgi:anti-anti-sigma factor
MAFTAQISREEGVAVCAVTGQLDTRASLDFERQLATDLKKAESCVLVDCRELDFITSAGLRVLLSLGKRLSADGGCLALCSLTPATQQVFEVAGFNAIFPIRPNRGDALTWLVAEGKVSRTAHMARSILKSTAEPNRDRRIAGSDSAVADLAAKLLRPPKPKS